MVCMVQPWAEGRLVVIILKYVISNVVLMSQTTVSTAAGTNCHDIRGCPYYRLDDSCTLLVLQGHTSSLTARSPCSAYPSAVS
jgi:hypothetical protein